MNLCEPTSILRVHLYHRCYHHEHRHVRIVCHEQVCLLHHNVHLLRLRLAASPQQTTELRGLCDLELIVAQPAAAVASARSQDHFLSRLVSP